MGMSEAVNILLGLLEMLNISLCTWYFMKGNGRTIYRKKGWYLLGFVLYTLALAFSNLLSPEVLVFPCHILAVLLLGALLFTRSSGALLRDVLLIFCIGIADTCVNLIFSISYLKDGTNLLLRANLAIAVKIVLEMALTRLFLFLTKKEKEQRLKPLQILALGALPAASLFFLFSLVKIGNVYIQLYGMWLILLNAAVILLVNVLFFYLIGYLLKANRMKQEMELFQAQSEIQYRYYTGLEKKYRESRKMIHDMKNHLQAVERLYRDQETQAGEEYVKDLYHMLNAMGEKYYSPNKMLNIILNDKLDQARSLGIEVKAEVGDADFSDLRDLDITTVFANLLDNAIEAAKCAEVPFLNLKINEVRDFRVVSIQNSRKVEEKPGAGHMGLGLENVRRTLEQYHGTMQIKKTDTEYQVNLMLPR